MKRIFNFLSPIKHLGDKNYSIVFPLLGTLSAVIILEFYAYIILGEPEAITTSAIFIFISLIIYFSFREGRRGGFIASIITISYYLYIIASREYQGERFVRGIETTVILAIIYFFLAAVIGWLKEVIDKLIEREANEKKRLETIFQQLPVGVVIADKNRKIVQANNRLNEIIGVKVPIGFQLGEGLIVSSISNGKPSTSDDDPLLQSLKTGKVVSNREFTITKNDHLVHLQVSAAPIKDRHNQTLAAASIISDITEQKNLEIRKDDFVNMASHELKTPLTSLKLYTEVMHRRLTKKNDKQLADIIKRAQDQLNRLQKLVDDLLDVSRIQTGKLTYTKERFNLSELVNETVEVLGETANSHNIIIEKTPNLQVHADRFRIYQVVTNLITNAIKYSPSNSEIRIQLIKNDSHALVRITDQGIGIPKEEHDKIFERLYQVFKTADKKSPGFGMGLFISKEIIERHKGKIWVESKLNEGSTFCFTLPLAKR